MGGVAAEHGFGHHFSVLHVEAQVHVGLVLVQVVVGHEHAALGGEESGVVEQCAVHAAAVGALDVDELVAASGQFRLCDEIGQCACVLHLGQADDGSPHGQFVGAEIRQHLGHVFQFGVVLHRAPLVDALGGVLVVVLPGVVDGVEEVFLVVESHAVEGIAFFVAAIALGL